MRQRRDERSKRGRSCKKLLRTSDDVKIDQNLDLRGVTACPINFVKAKLKLECMQPGQVLEIIIDDGELIKSVPLAIREEGHEIIGLKKIGDRWELLIKK